MKRKDVSITFSGVSSPILKAVASFKLQRRNLKNVPEDERQAIVDELDDLFIVMISDSKLNKNRPVWDYIKIKEKYFEFKNNVAHLSNKEKFEIRYHLYNRMIENNVTFETALYCLYENSSDVAYAKSIDIKHVDRILNDIIERKYLHNSIMKLDEDTRKIFLWMVCTFILGKNGTLSDFLPTLVMFLSVVLSVKGYKDSKVIKHRGTESSIAENSSFFYYALGAASSNGMYFAYNSITIIPLTYYIKNVLMENDRTKKILSSETILNIIASILSAEKGVNIYSEIFISLVVFLNSATEYDIEDFYPSMKTLEFKFENDNICKNLKKLLLLKLKTSDIKKVLSVKINDDDLLLSYYTIMRKLNITNDKLEKRLFELKLK